jgi:hypothetical protein
VLKFVLEKLKSLNFLKAIADIKNQDSFHLFSTLGFLFLLLRSEVKRCILCKLYVNNQQANCSYERIITWGHGKAKTQLARCSTMGSKKATFAVPHISKLAKKFLGFHRFSSVSRFPETWKLGNPETHEDLGIYLKTITNLITS